MKCKDLQPFLLQDLHTFDQTEEGWRSLPSVEAAEVIQSYIKNHNFPDPLYPHLGVGLLWFHAGQNWAFSGYNIHAMGCFKKAVDNPWNTNEWVRYVTATYAFFIKDRDLFDVARVGAMNSGILDEMGRNWELPYAEVYTKSH